MAAPSSNSHENAGGVFHRVCHWFKSLGGKIRTNINEAANEAKRLAKEDPRRIVHSLKVGLALFLVSLFYYFDNPIYKGFGISAMWAVITVVVVFEFSVGATLGRGVNRGVATLIAGGLGVGANRLASFSGDKFESMVLGLFVFLIASAVSFVRFFPNIKARYDYGLLIFILTFCMVCVSAYRDDEVLDMADARLTTVLVGGATAIVVCTCICPVWAGDDLHHLVAVNIEKLADFLQGFGGEYFKIEGDEESKDVHSKAFMQRYKDALNSKSTEESLANFATWEPRHGRFRYRHPWQQYLKIGALVRQCACRIETLNGYLNSEIKGSNYEVRAIIEESCTNMSTQCSFALRELSFAMTSMTWPFSYDNIHSPIAKSKIAAEKLKITLRSESRTDTDHLMEIIPVASLLIEVVACSEKIAESVHELASMANFKNKEEAAEINLDDEQPQLTDLQRTAPPYFSFKRPEHVISIDASSQGPGE